MIKLKLKERIIFLVSFLFILTIVLLNFHISLRFLNFSKQLVEEKLVSDVNSLNFHLEESARNSRTAAVSMSSNPKAIDAIRRRDTSELISLFYSVYDLYRVNYFTITDNEGIVIARTHEPDRFGDSILGQRNIRDALSGRVSTYYEEGTVVKVSVRTGAPVYDTDGTLIGAISAGVRFDTYETVDELSSLLNADVSIFLRDKRLSTTIIYEEYRAEGTIIDPQIAEKVIGEKQVFSGRVNILGRQYETYYKPLVNSNNEAFAIIFLGINVDDLHREANDMFIEAILIGLMGVTISIILLRALNNAMQASRAKSAFLSIMSHEIRTPMNVILGVTDSQLMNKSLPQKVKESFEKIFDSGQLLLGIINDILDLSKIENGKLELVPVNYDIQGLINDTVNMCLVQYGYKQLKFKLSIDENIPRDLLGDELRIKQVLNNLLSNAFKYTDTGEIELLFNFEWITENKKIKLIISVRDTGQGLTPEQIKKMFKETYTRFNLEANRTTAGTGLGMTITRNLITFMKGGLNIESTAGKGSKFTVWIPQEITGTKILGRKTALELQNFNSSAAKRERQAKITREPMPYGKVLVVDDMQSNLDVAKLLLKPYQLQIDTANSGFEALDIIKSGKEYDIIFMDHMMPRMDGMETTKKLREDGYKGTVIALTANAIAGQQEVFLANGFDGFISKPIDIRQMNAILNNYIRDRHPSEAVLVSQKKEKQSAVFSSEEKESENISLYTDAFVRDALRAAAVLDAIMEKNNKGTLLKEDIRKFIIYVHGMKTVCANVDEMELSAAAMKLEVAARQYLTSEHSEVSAEKDIKNIMLGTAAFTGLLKKAVEELTSKDLHYQNGISLTEDEKRNLYEKLKLIKTACASYDAVSADKVLTELMQKQWQKDVKDLLSAISENLLHSNFEKATENIDKFTA